MAEFGSDEFTESLFQFYLKQVELIEELYKDATFYNVRGRMSGVYPLFFSLHSTGLAIAHLAKGKFLNESFMLARSQIEKIINYMYLLCCEDAEYQNYLTYSKQKQFKMFNRSVKVGDLKAEISADVNSPDRELQEALDKFTSKSGKDSSKWSKRSIQQRLGVIEPKVGKDIGVLMFSYLGIHENASEALHGSLYGVTFNMGVWFGKAPSSVEELQKYWNEQFSMLFFMLGTCLHTLYKTIHQEVPVDVIMSKSLENVTATKSFKPHTSG